MSMMLRYANLDPPHHPQFAHPVFGKVMMNFADHSPVTGVSW